MTCAVTLLMWVDWSGWFLLFYKAHLEPLKHRKVRRNKSFTFSPMLPTSPPPPFKGVHIREHERHVSFSTGK